MGCKRETNMLILQALLDLSMLRKPSKRLLRLLPLLLQLHHHALEHANFLNGREINGVMTTTTIVDANGMVEIVVEKETNTIPHIALNANARILPSKESSRFLEDFPKSMTR